MSACATGLLAFLTSLPALAQIKNSVFLEPVKRQTNASPKSTAIGDVNGDGRADVITAGDELTDGVGLQVFLQDATGQLAMVPVTYTGGTAGPILGDSIDAGDVNQDGKDDVVVSYGGGIGVFLQTAAGTLAPMVAHATATNFKIRIADLNSDGRNDVVGIDWGSQSEDVNVLLQTTQGQLAAPVTYLASHGGWDDLEVGDVTGDGKTDIVVMSGQGLGPDMSVLVQGPSGAFLPQVTYQAPSTDLAGGIGLGDVTGDGHADAVLSLGWGKKLAVFPQMNGAFGVSQLFDAGVENPEPVEIADVTGDGHADVVVMGNYGAIRVFLQQPNGTLAPGSSTSVFASTSNNRHAMALGDVNGDGKTDAAIASQGLSGVQILHGTRADLGLTVTPPAAAMIATLPAVFTFTVRNTGPDPVTQAVAHLTFPDPLRTQAVTPSQGTCSSWPSVDCDLGDIAVGAQATITLEAASDDDGQFTVEGLAEAFNYDPDPQNSRVSEPVTVLPAADLSVAALPSYTSGGAQDGFIVFASGNGPDDAPETVVTVELGSGLAFNGADWTDTTKAPGGTCTSSGTTVTCALGNLPITDAFMAPFTPQIHLRLSGGGQLVARIDSAIDDPDPSNNTTTANLVAGAGGPGPGPGDVPGIGPVGHDGGCGCRAAGAAGAANPASIASLLVIAAAWLRRSSRERFRRIRR